MINNKDNIINIRTKILGVLIRDARLSARRSTKECANALGISFRRYRSFESGQLSPSLPELESLAYFLEVPIKHFWNNRSISENDKNKNVILENNDLSARDYAIGMTIRDARNKKGITLKQLAIDTEITEKMLRKYELGKSPIPVPELELLLQILDIPLEQVFDGNNEIGVWQIQQNNIDNFLKLPYEAQEFIINESNMPFIELAQKLKGLPADKIREIAEGLLEITL